MTRQVERALHEHPQGAIRKRAQVRETGARVAERGDRRRVEVAEAFQVLLDRLRAGDGGHHQRKLAAPGLRRRRVGNEIGELNVGDEAWESWLGRLSR